MSEDTNTQIVEPQSKPYVERPLIEKPISTEVATQSQEADIETPDIGQLVQESKKYRKRAQESEAKAQQSEAKYETLNKKLEVDRQKQMEEQNQWQQLAEERAVKIAEMEPIVASFRKDEADQREQILSDFTDADREEFGELKLTQLRALHTKLINNNTVAPTSGAPARSLNPDNKHWTDMGKKERQENWGNIVNGYSVRK